MTNLKNNRIAFGMTQKELSERSGVNLRIIQYYEQGYRNINKAEAMTVYKIAEALGCSVKDILEFNDE